MKSTMTTAEEVSEVVNSAVEQAASDSGPVHDRLVAAVSEASEEFYALDPSEKVEAVDHLIAAVREYDEVQESPASIQVSWAFERSAEDLRGEKESTEDFLNSVLYHLLDLIVAERLDRGE